MAVSKRAKMRMKHASASEKLAVKKAVKVLFEAELMGSRRYAEILRVAGK
jgi:hypothetical protein